jgi:hypothetical protein
MGTIEPIAEPPIINISGEKVAPGPMQRDQLGLYFRWFNISSVPPRTRSCPGATQRHATPLVAGRIPPR